MSSEVDYLSRLPAVAVDKIISYLSDENLRSLYQVSKTWQKNVENRPKDNIRRIKLVEIIRRNKENFVDTKNVKHSETLWTAKTPQSPNPYNKPGAKILVESLSRRNIQKSQGYSNATPSPSPAAVSTPMAKFEFQEYEKMERSLEKGQKLFQCGKCRGPVPSPIPSQLLYGENSTVVTPVKSSRCGTTRRKVNSAVRNLFKRSPSKPERKKTKMGDSILLECDKIDFTNSSPSIDLPTSPYSPNVSFAVRQLDFGNSDDSFGKMDLDLSQNKDSSYRFHDSGIFDSNLDLSICSNFIPSPATTTDAYIRNTKRQIQHSSSSEGSNEEIPDMSNIFRSPYTSSSGSSLMSKDRIESISSSHDTNSSAMASTISVLRVGSGTCEPMSPANIDSNLRSFEQSMNCLSLHDDAFQIGKLDASDSISCPDLNDSYVLECPKCSFRFCSTCNESEHTGRSCRVVGSSFLLSSSCDNIYEDNYYIDEASQKAKSRSAKEKKKKKSSLRRLAKL